MNFILVPFLLGVRLPANEEQWKNGPEYTFKTSLSMISNMEVDKGLHMASALYVTMKCRPKEPSRLYCRFEDPKITKFVASKFEAEAAIPADNASSSIFGFGNAAFEILFNDEGVESYKFESDSRLMSDYLVNMYRLIANHLSVGFKFRKDVLTPLRKLENSTVGECYVTYNVTQKTLDEPVVNKDYQLYWLPNQRIEPEHATEIIRETHLNDCLIHPVYFFGTRHTFGIVPVESIEKLQSSTGRVFVSNANFTSESTNKVQIYNLKRKVIGTVLDYIRVSLVSVTPPVSEMGEMSNATIVGPILKKDVKCC